MNVIAHSLGNMVVNSALNRPEAADALKAGAIKVYVMNEAAIPSEAFDTGTPAAPSSALVKYAQSNDGYTDDGIWQTQINNFTTDQSQSWNSKLNASNYATVPKPYYNLRWRQGRPSSGVPDSADPLSMPQRGSWLGFFASNPKYVTMINTVNAKDAVLGNVWELAEVATKPNVAMVTTYVGGFTQLPAQFDDANIQFWANLRNTDAAQEYTWGGDGCTNVMACPHSNIIRQWAELAYWFPSVSWAEGSGGLSNSASSTTPITPTVTSVDFSMYAPAFSSSLDLSNFNSYGGSPTHSYLVMQPYSIVSPAWMQIRSCFK